MRFLRQAMTGLFLAALTAALLVWAGALVRDAVQEKLADSPRGRPAQERVFAVNIVEAQPDTIQPVLQAFGQVQSRRTLEIRASAAGTVVEVAENFVEGGLVKAGEVLARIDPAQAEAALRSAEADLLDAEAEVRDADRALLLARDDLTATRGQAELQEKALQRQLDLQNRGVGSASAVETAELAVAQASANVLSSRQALANAEARIDLAKTALSRAQIARDEAERDLNDTVIRAGFDGALSAVNVVEGGLVSQNEAMATVVDPMLLEVSFRVSTEQFARLLDDTGALRAAPANVVLDVAGGNIERPATLTRASAAVAEGQSGRQLFARIDDPRGLKPGDFVRVETMEPALENVVRLPATSVDSLPTVLVMNEDDRLTALPITLLRRQGDTVLVRGDGLAGQRVVAERTPLLGTGIKVRALGQPEAPPEMIELSEERRAALVAYVDANTRMPAAAKERIKAELQEKTVSKETVDRLESRMGS